MSDFDESLEQLLSNAPPRRQPDQAAAAVAREAVRADWLAVTGRRRSRKRIFNFALAATVLISVFSLFNSFRGVDLEFVRIASIQKSIGSIYVLGEQAELTLAADLAAIHVGQTIVTGDDAGMALAWGNGGSVRLDKNTQVEFRSDTSVYLQSGRIYYDSTPSGLIAGGGAGGIDSFRIETDFGAVSHVGTQFMTEIESDELRVSVREGKVDVAGRYYDHTTSRGKQVFFAGRQRPVEFSIPEYGGAWEWIAQTSPAVNIDGQSVEAFLAWVGRELGMRVDSDGVESTTMLKELRGHVDMAPAEALRLLMPTAALDWRFAEGVIYVSDSH